jgi:hypothetical protein
MEIDLDKPASRKWELRVKYRGELFRTVPITHKQMIQANAIVSDKTFRPAKARALIKLLFIEPEPDVDSWPADLLLFVLVGVMNEYLRWIAAITRGMVHDKQFGAN